MHYSLLCSAAEGKNKRSDALCRSKNDFYSSCYRHTASYSRTKIGYVYETNEKIISPTRFGPGVGSI